MKFLDYASFFKLKMYLFFKSGGKSLFSCTYVDLGAEDPGKEVDTTYMDSISDCESECEKTQGCYKYQFFHNGNDYFKCTIHTYPLTTCIKSS